MVRPWRQEKARRGPGAFACDLRRLLQGRRGARGDTLDGQSDGDDAGRDQTVLRVMKCTVNIDLKASEQSCTPSGPSSIGLHGHHHSMACEALRRCVAGAQATATVTVTQ
nr:hypothetical protein CFP56_00578 [Quercus suber]